MSRIDELIESLCPEGVHFLELGTLVDKVANVNWAAEGDRLFQYIDLSSVDRVTKRIGATETINRHNAPSRAQQLVQAGDIVFGTTRPLLKRFAVITPEFAGQIASTGYFVMRPKAEKILSSYLLHIVGTARFYEFVEANEKGASYPAISDSVVRRFRMPVPPLEVQQEIVRILDQFTQLEAELEAELEARRRQFSAYRKELLSTDFDELTRARLGDVLDLKAGKFISASEIFPNADETHAIPCFGGGGLRGFVAEGNHEGDHVLIGRQGALCGNVKRSSGSFYATEHAVVVTPGSGIDLSWSYHLLTFMDLNQYASKSAQPGLAVGTLNQLEISIPSFEEQSRIGRILDSFESLTESMSNGLPAEIDARRKQYEYYRDKLLTFKELAA